MDGKWQGVQWDSGCRGAARDEHGHGGVDNYGRDDQYVCEHAQHGVHGESRGDPNGGLNGDSSGGDHSDDLNGVHVRGIHVRNVLHLVQ